MKATVSLSEVMVSAPLDAIRLSEITDAIETAGAKVDIVSGTDCMAAFLADGSEHLPLPISRFLAPDYRSRAANFGIDYIIVLGQAQTDGQETEIVTTVINYGDSSQATTAQIHAEGKMRAFWPILPYVALFVFYSEPDTQSGLSDAIGSVVSQVIQQDGKSTRARLLILESENLVEIARSVPRFVSDSDSLKQTDEESSKNN
jgi:hypothetical protein